MKKLLIFFWAVLCCHNLAINATTITNGVLNIDGEDYGQLYVRNDAVVNVLGDTVSTFYLGDNSSLYVIDGTITGSILASDQSRVNFSGGFIDEILVNRECELQLSGGAIHTIKSVWYEYKPGKMITINCDTSKTQYNITDGILKGEWLNGESFAIQLIDTHGFSNLYEKITFIAEPGSLLLITSGFFYQKMFNRYHTT